MAITLNDLIEKIDSFEKDEISADTLKEYIDNNIGSKIYIPTVEKGLIANNAYKKTIGMYNPNENNFSFGTEVYFTLNFMILMAYGDILYDEKDMTYSNYDKLCLYGIRNFVLSNCKDDYREFYEILNFMISFTMYDAIVKATSISNIDEFKNAVAELDSLVADDRKVKTLREYIEYNHPELKK